MQSKSLKVKILLIFTIPILTLLYFSINSILNEYKKLYISNIIKSSSYVISSISDLVYNIQLERGLEAGYIVADNKVKYNKQLTKQYIKSDQAYKKYTYEIQQYPTEIFNKNTHSIIEDINKEFAKITKIRKTVEESNIDYSGIINYYTSINSKLILLMKFFYSVHNESTIDTISIIKLELLKEQAGLERAYIYNNLISNTLINTKHNIEQFKIEQENKIYEFLKFSSKNSVNIYSLNFSKDILNTVEICRDGLIYGSLNHTNASECFNHSSKYIEMLNKISKEIFSNYILNVQKKGSQAQNSLYITSSLWLISFISLIILFFISRTALIENERSIDKLRIASYAFNAHEAMAITDIHATILKINSSFSEITGYSKEEVIGKQMNILNSKKHDEEFFKNMWNTIIDAGKWDGEIYNKKKNGKIYTERLSITAIKNEDNETTHYIAHFLDISDIKNAQKIAEYQANHDYLTDTLNKKSLKQKLNEFFFKAKENGFIHAFLFIDLDNFKSINDNYGHSIGDMLIIEVAQRLRNTIRKEDVLARLSGDEFAIVLTNLNQNIDIAKKEVRNICDKFLKTISKEFLLEDNKINITLSIGISIFPDDKKNIQDIIVSADKAMYKAKELGKNKFVLS